MAASALCRDHPEYENYFDIEEVVEGDRTTALRACYFLPYDATGAAADTKQIKEEMQIFEEECHLIVSAIPKTFSTYDKYRYLAAVISLRTTYDNDSVGGKPSATAYGAIEGGRPFVRAMPADLNTFAARQICGAHRSAACPKTPPTPGTW